MPKTKTKKISRNYKLEAQWSKQHYKQYICKLGKDESTILDDILKKNGIGFTEFVKISAFHLQKYTIEKEYKLK